MVFWMGFGCGSIASKKVQKRKAPNNTPVPNSIRHFLAFAMEPEALRGCLSKQVVDEFPRAPTTI